MAAGAYNMMQQHIPMLQQHILELVLPQHMRHCENKANSAQLGAELGSRLTEEKNVLHLNSEHFVLSPYYLFPFIFISISAIVVCWSEQPSQRWTIMQIQGEFR